MSILKPGIVTLSIFFLLGIAESHVMVSLPDNDDLLWSASQTAFKMAREKKMDPRVKVPPLSPRSREKWQRHFLKYYQTQGGLGRPQWIHTRKYPSRLQILVKGIHQNSSRRNFVRKKLALMYAGFSWNQIKLILEDLDSLKAAEEDIAFLKNKLPKDIKMIQTYADFLEIPIIEFKASLKLAGDNMKAVNLMEQKNPKVKFFVKALASKENGLILRDFLRSQTAHALNLDMMLLGPKEKKAMSPCLILNTAANTFSLSVDQNEGFKAAVFKLFALMPMTKVTLGISEKNFKESLKGLVLEVLSVSQLAELAYTYLDYSDEIGKETLLENDWLSMVQEALKGINKLGFEETEIGFYRIGNRYSLLPLMEEQSGSLFSLHFFEKMSNEIEARLANHLGLKTNKAALFTVQWFEPIPLEDLKEEIQQQFKAEEYRKDKKIDHIVKKRAAPIIYENLKVAQEIKRQIFFEFIDRLEEHYNELRTVSKDISDLDKIKLKTKEILRKELTSIPHEIKESALSFESVQEQYNEKVFFINFYPHQDKSVLEMKREMQQAIDDFRAFLKKHVLRMSLHQDLLNVNVQALILAGSKPMNVTDQILLGDQFRIGISARIKGKLLSQKITIYYYLLSNITEDLKLLGEVPLGTEVMDERKGYSLKIDPYDKRAHLFVTPDFLSPEFEREGTYEIFPVLAFGEWDMDPVAQVGFDVLINPVENADYFEMDRIAFVGNSTSFSIIRAELDARLPTTVVLKGNFNLETYLKVPSYFKEEMKSEVEIRVIPPEESLALVNYPSLIKGISTNPLVPSKIPIALPQEAQGGFYQIEIKARIEGIQEKAQPFEKTIEFEYVNKENPSPPEGGDIGQDELRENFPWQSSLKKSRSLFSIVEKN